MISPLKPFDAATSRSALPADPYYQALWAKLQSPENGHAFGKLFGLTSSRRREGVTTVTSNLAITAAEQGNKVLLIDANPLNPSVYRAYGVAANPGLHELFRTGGELSEFVQPCETPNLTLLTAGELPANLARASDAAWAHMLHQAKQEFDWVFVDLPALEQGGVTLRVAGLFDGIALVIEAERIRREVAERAKDSLVQARAKLIGAILNKRRHYVPGWLYRIT